MLGLVHGQEICDNAIDDDLDGLIDLNDPDCDCEVPVLNLVPNGSFEEMSCCPEDPGDGMECVDHWVEAGGGGAEFEHACADLYYGYPELPIPGGGEGYVAINVGGALETSNEYFGVELEFPMLAGNVYMLSLYSSAYVFGTLSLDLSIYGTPFVEEFPISDDYIEYCPDGYYNWTLLGNDPVTYPTAGPWVYSTISITPATDVEAIIIGGSCAGGIPSNTFFIDEIELVGGPEELDIIDIFSDGNWCTNDLILFTSSDSLGGTWQWYKDGIALVGETSSVLDVMLYGIGNYSVVYHLGSICQQIDYAIELPPNPEAAILLDATQCFSETIPTGFSNSSTIETGDMVAWEWDFGDGTNSAAEYPPFHYYPSAGTYNMTLVVTSDLDCTDTTSVEITIYPSPIAEISFEADGVSSDDGSTGGCITNPVLFFNESTIEPSSEIVSWYWDFGDGGISIEENPSHIYTNAGLYTVKLLVESELGCEDSAFIDIVMTNGLEDLSNDTLICIDGTATIIATGTDPYPFTYDWTLPGADDGPVQTVNATDAPIMVYVQATNPAGCMSTIDSVYISVRDSINIVTLLPDSLCIDENFNGVITASGGDGTYSYSWTNAGTIFSEIGPNTMIEGIEPTVICVTVNDGCETPAISICQDLYVPQFPSFAVDTTEGCIGAEFELTNLTGPNPDLLSFTWLIADMTSFGDTATVSFENAGFYNVSLTVNSTDGCEATALIPSFIQVHPNPEPSFYATPNPLSILESKVKLVNNNPTFGSSFQWIIPGGSPNYSLSDSMVVVIYPELVIDEYEVILIEKTLYNCVDSTRLIIKVQNDHILYAPNAFTPDGDTYNDTWQVHIEGLDIYDFHLTIFNRWGEIIWESYDANAAWDGSYGGEIVNTGTYVWQIIAKDGHTDKAYAFEGVVNVLR